MTKQAPRISNSLKQQSHNMTRQQKTHTHKNKRAYSAPPSPHATAVATQHDRQVQDTTVEMIPSEEPTMLPGLKPVLELVQSAPDKVDTVFIRKSRHGKELDALIDICRYHKVRFSLLESSAFGTIYAQPCQGVVARIFARGFISYEELLETMVDAPLPLIVAFDQLQDPGNAGTLARTLYALGGAGIVIPRHNSVFLGGAAQKAAAGALSQLPVAKVGNLNQAIDYAKDRGIPVYGAAAAGSKNASIPSMELYSSTLHLPALLILGSEASGMREHVAKRCDAFIHIPLLRTFDSLNVAQAGGIIISWLAHMVSSAQTSYSR